METYIKKSDALMATFIGGKYNKDLKFNILNDEIWIPKFGVCSIGKSGKQLKFSKSWDWIMEVVEKIEALGFIFNSTGKAVSIHEISGEFIFDGLGSNYSTKSEAYYDACLEFINWYNKNNK